LPKPMSICAVMVVATFFAATGFTAGAAAGRLTAAFAVGFAGLVAAVDLAADAALVAGAGDLVDLDVVFFMAVIVGSRSLNYPGISSQVSKCEAKAPARYDFSQP
jgi:hypothetical protein